MSTTSALAREVMANPRDYYAVLQVRRGADEAEIRRSYYKLSLKLHPDKNQGDASAEQAYRVVNHCYETLMDSTKRGLYDMYGEEGLQRFSRFGDEMPSMKELLSFAVTYWAYLIARRAAIRAGCMELLDLAFPGIAAARAAMPNAPDGSGVSTADPYEEHLSFAKAHAPAKRAARRWLLQAILVGTAMTVLLLAGMRLFVSPRWGLQDAVALAVEETDTERIARLQRTLLSPRRGSTAASALAERDATVFTLRGACLGLADGEEALRCASNSSNSHLHGNDFVVTAVRFGGSEADAVLAYHALVHETCAQEALLAAASRDRFQVTSSLPVCGAAATALKSPNRAPRRRYPERRWRPKFTPSYSVADRSELFQMSPLCVRLAALSRSLPK